MGTEGSTPKSNDGNNEQWVTNKTVIDQCVQQQAQYSDKQLQDIYETNEIPEEHQTLYNKFHKAYLHHLTNSTQYIEKTYNKKMHGKCCRFDDKTINPNKIQITTISLQEWTHIKTYHSELYNALRNSPRRHHRYQRLDVVRRERANTPPTTQTIPQSTTKIENKVICNEQKTDNTDTRRSSFLGVKHKPMLILKKSHQCSNAEDCFEYQDFCQLYQRINKKEPEFAKSMYEHCILYHVEDFPPQCECKLWDSKSTSLQHIIHGHWYHRDALTQLQNNKRLKEQRKKNTPKIKYTNHHQHIPRLSTKASLRSVMGKAHISENFDQLQFGAPYKLKRESAMFKNPKQEMLKNEFRNLSKREWNDLLRKCVLLAKAHEARANNLSIKQIVALKLYTDFDELQRQFRKCFRSEELKRQRQFFWWNQLLEIACNKSKDIIKKKVYHGVSSELILSTFSGTYYGPVSTTTIYDVARGFAGKSGKILELYPSFGRKGLKVSWLSNFPDEEEILYMNTSFQIHNMYRTSNIGPKISMIGGLKMTNTNEASYFEQAVMEAIQSINVDSKVISLNTNSQFNIVEDSEIKEDDISGFVELSSRTQLAVLYLLYLQYRKDEWDDFVGKTDQFVKQAFSRFRSEFVLLAENVQAVKMEKLSKMMQVFFYANQKYYQFPFEAYDTKKIEHKKQAKIPFKPNQPFRIDTIVRLFPNAEQISINANNWDFSLAHFIVFLQTFDMDYANVKLQDIYIKFTSKKSISNSKHKQYEIVTDDQKAQELMNAKVNASYARKQLTILRALGWQFITPSHLHRVGFEPAPELPFVMIFVRERKHTKFFYQSYSMQFTNQQIQAIGNLEDDFEPGTSGDCDDDQLEPGQILSPSVSYLDFKSNSEEKSLEQVNDEMHDGDKYVIVHHNPANCILSSKIFDTLEYKKDLIEFLKFRKERKSGKISRKQAKFIELCKKVETLVLDPMPKELHEIFMECPNKPIISFATIFRMFPKVKELFLRNTVLNLRICYHLVKFDKEYGDKSRLERIFFNNAKRDETIKDRYVMRFKLVLEPYLWQITKSECMIHKSECTIK